MKFLCPACQMAYHIDDRENYFEICRTCRIDQLTKDALKSDQPAYEKFRRLAILSLKKLEERHEKRFPIADKNLRENEPYAVYLRMKKSVENP